jgi:hypothetical protein
MGARGAGYKAVCVIALGFLVFLLFAGSGAVLATQIEVEGELPGEVEEKQVISLVLTISNIPAAADFISFDTDLVRYGKQPIYNFTGLELQSNNSSFVLPVEDNRDKIVVRLNGRVPVIREVKQCDELTLIKYDPKLTGYAYYRVRLTDEDGNPLGESDTRTFTIMATEIEEFRGKMTLVDDSFFSVYLQDMFDKGLVTEANEIADHVIEEEEKEKEKEKEREEEGSFSWGYVFGGLALLALGFILGVRFGGSGEEEEE